MAEATDVPSPPEQQPRFPSVDWWMTSHCNLACDYCYGPPPQNDPIEWRDQIFEALAASSARVVTFCGGEPLMVPRVGEYAASLRRIGKSAVLNTNGQLLHMRMRQGLSLDDFNVVGISLDGSTSEVHCAMRGKRANFDEVLRAARVVGGHPGVSLKLATVVSKVNRDDLLALADTVRELQPAVWRLYQYSGRGDWNRGRERHRLPDDDFKRLARAAAERAVGVSTAPSTEAETSGCLIVNQAGGVLKPAGNRYVPCGNCLDRKLDSIWAEVQDRETIIKNKHWLTILN